MLLQHPDLNISFLKALDIPEGPSSLWSKIEFLNLLELPHLAKDTDDDDDDHVDDAEEPEDGPNNP